jgi:hypothetical protein
VWLPYHLQRLLLEEAAFRTTSKIKVGEYSPNLTWDEVWLHLHMMKSGLNDHHSPWGRHWGGSHRLSHRLAVVACRKATSQSWPIGSRSTSHTSSSSPKASPIYKDSPAICTMFFSSFANCVAAQCIPPTPCRFLLSVSDFPIWYSDGFFGLGWHCCSSPSGFTQFWKVYGGNCGLRLGFKSVHQS